MHDINAINRLIYRYNASSNLEHLTHKIIRVSIMKMYTPRFVVVAALVRFALAGPIYGPAPNTPENSKSLHAKKN